MIIEKYAILPQYASCYFSLFFLIVIGISSAYFLFSVTLGNNNTNINTIINTNVNTGAVIYYIYKWEISNKLIQTY